MKKWFMLILAMVLMTSCVGRRDDPEDGPGPGDDPATPQEEPPKEGTRFYHRVLALVFTGTWCQYCPNMAVALEAAQRARPGRIVEIAVHQHDGISASEADAIVDAFKVSSFPSMVFDWDVSTKFTEQNTAQITGYVDSTVPTETCGLSSRTEVEGELLNVTVKIFAKETSDYAVAAALVEDGIEVTQAGAGAGYVCYSVLVRYLGSGIGGEPVNGLKEGDEASVSFSTPAPGGDLSKYRVVVYALQDGKAINALSVGINDNVNYQYEKDN